LWLEDDIEKLKAFGDKRKKKKLWIVKEVDEDDSEALYRSSLDD